MSFSGIPLTKSVILLSHLLRSWGMLSSFRMTSWLRAALRRSRHLSVSVPGGVWFLVCLVHPTSTPQGYTAPSPHPHPRMRTLPLAGARGTFGWALLWSTLLASFPVQSSAAALYNIALCGNIITSILWLVEGYFPGWYHFVTYLGHAWTSKVQDCPHFS